MPAETALLFSLALCAFLLGANNASNGVGPAIGGKVASYAKVSILFAAGLVAGLVAEGWKMLSALSAAQAPVRDPYVAAVILGVAAMVTAFATFLKMPLPVTFAIVGGLLGVCHPLGLKVSESYVQWVLASWATTPLVAVVLGVVLARALMSMARKIGGVTEIYTLYGCLSLFGAFYIAYVLGANTLGLMSSIYGGEAHYALAGAIAGAMAVVGVLSLGWVVAEKLGTGFVKFGATTTLAAQLSGALTIHFFTQFGIPVSITQAMVGGIIGAGLAKGVRAVNPLELMKLVIFWTLTPLACYALLFLLYSFH